MHTLTIPTLEYPCKLVLRWLLKIPPFSNTVEEKPKENNTGYKHKYKNIDERDYFERLKQAIKYVNKIIKEDGKISEDKLYKVLARFKVSEEDLLRETGLVMRETGEYYPM